MVSKFDAAAGTFPGEGVEVCCCALDEEGAWWLRFVRTGGERDVEEGGADDQVS